MAMMSRGGSGSDDFSYSTLRSFSWEESTRLVLELARSIGALVTNEE
jgi:hypothetical protein